MAQNLSGMLRSTFVSEHFRSVTEIAWSQPFLCVNRIPGLFGMIFAAALKLYGNSVNILSVFDLARTVLYLVTSKSFITTPSS